MKWNDVTPEVIKKYPGRSGGFQDYICLHHELGVWATKEKRNKNKKKKWEGGRKL